ncbi:MAG TPA: ABC transporter permease [Opitutales bacterium]|nr:ABC transporter permease [Opitutales bacterium]
MRIPKLLPFAYATRNLLRDPARFAQKVGGSALVVFLVFAAGSFNRGMDAVLSASGSDENVILLGAGSEESVERSEIAVQTETLAAAGISGISRRLDMPAISGEVHFMGQLSIPGQEPAQALLRGITPSAFAVHQKVRLIEGRFPRSGEVIVGRLAHHVIGAEKSELALGEQLQFEGQDFRIVGIFEAPGTVMESEVWMDRVDLMTLTQRESLSCVIARLEDESAFSAADLFAKQRLDLELSAIRESSYYEKVSAFFGPIRAMTWLTAGLIAAGAVFGGFNMLYAAFASRIRELATLQAIGYTRTAVFISLVQESLLATLSGTMVAAFAAVWLLEGQTVYFSIGTFFLQLSPGVVLAGLLTGFLLGLLGSIPPAVRCLGASLPASLRS